MVGWLVATWLQQITTTKNRDVFKRDICSLCCSFPAQFPKPVASRGNHFLSYGPGQYLLTYSARESITVTNPWASLPFLEGIYDDLDRRIRHRIVDTTCSNGRISCNFEKLQAAVRCFSISSAVRSRLTTATGANLCQRLRSTSFGAKERKTHNERCDLRSTSSIAFRYSRATPRRWVFHVRI